MLKWYPIYNYKWQNNVQLLVVLRVVGLPA